MRVCVRCTVCGEGDDDSITGYYDDGVRDGDFRDGSDDEFDDDYSHEYSNDGVHNHVTCTLSPLVHVLGFS